MKELIKLAARINQTGMSGLYPGATHIADQYAVPRLRNKLGLF